MFLPEPKLIWRRWSVSVALRHQINLQDHGHGASTVRRMVWQRQWGVNHLPNVVAQQRRGRGSNPRPLDRKSDALPLSHRATLLSHRALIDAASKHPPLA